MPSRSVIRCLLTLAALGSTGALSNALGAQVSAATGVSALMQRQTNDPWQSATRLDPTVRLDGRWFQMTTAATLLGGSNRGVRMDDGSIDFLAAPAAVGPFRLTTTGRVERQSVSPFAQHTSGTIESDLSMRVGNWGGWLGVAAEHTREIDSARVEPLARFGIWRQFENVTLSLSREAHSTFNKSAIGGRGDTLNNSGSRTLGWTSTEARVSWALKGVYFDTRFGIQPKLGTTTPQAYWGNGSATVPLNSRLSVVAAAGNQPALAWIGAPAKRFASLGLRVAPAALVHPAPPANVRPNASAFSLSPIGHADYVVTMRVPSARAVELSGDFNGWKPVALRETRPSVWETTLTLRPGTYHMNVRVNGDSWTAPPGLPAANDDFNGTVGLVVIR